MLGVGRQWIDLELLPVSTTLFPPPALVAKEFRLFLAERFTEIIVLVEGVEPTTSCTLQARHSYLFPKDVVWDHDFADCMNLGTESRPSSVNFSRFHELVSIPVSYDPSHAAVLRSRSAGRLTRQRSSESETIARPNKEKVTVNFGLRSDIEFDSSLPPAPSDMRHSVQRPAVTWTPSQGSQPVGDYSRQASPSAGEHEEAMYQSI